MFLTLIIGFIIIICLVIIYYDLQQRNKYNQNYLIQDGKKIVIPYFNPTRSLLSGIIQLFSGAFQGKDFMKQFDYSSYDSHNYQMIQGHLLHFPVIWVWSVEHSKNIQFTNDTDIGKASFGAAFDDFIGDSILQVHGKEWKQHKDILSPAFAWKHIQSILPQFLDIINELSSIWNNLDNSKSIDISSWMYKATLDGIGRGGFGFNFHALTSSETQEIKQYHKLMDEFSNPIHFFRNFDKLLGTRKKFDNMIDDFQNFMNNLISAKRNIFIKAKENGETPIPEDILDFLIYAQDNNTLNDHQIIHDMNTFFIAGHETTNASLTSALHLLARNQDIQDKLRNEIISICGNDTLSYDHIRKMHYLEACIKETLRLLPPATLILREALHDQQVGNMIIKKGTTFAVNIYSIHHDSTYWGSDVNEFNPERFLPENKDKLIRNAYLPFSLGQRQCIGNNFAQLEIKSFLAVLIQNFKFTPDPNSPVPFGEYQTNAAYSVTPGCTLNISPIKQ